MAKDKKEKKDSNLLVILLILILMLLIILPPTFRMLFPKEEEQSSNNTTREEKNNRTSLSCRKTTTDGYNVTATTIYQNNEITRVNISYVAAITTNDATTEQGTTTTTDPDGSTNGLIQDPTSTVAPAVIDDVAGEMVALKTIQGIVVNENETNHQFSLDMQKVDLTTIPDFFKERLQMPSLQKIFYETLGYTCVKNNT